MGMPEFPMLPGLQERHPLPEGMHCSDCGHFRACHMLHWTTAGETSCDWPDRSNFTPVGGRRAS